MIQKDFSSAKLQHSSVYLQAKGEGGLILTEHFLWFTPLKTHVRRDIKIPLRKVIRIWKKYDAIHVEYLSPVTGFEEVLIVAVRNPHLWVGDVKEQMMWL